MMFALKCVESPDPQYPVGPIGSNFVTQSHTAALAVGAKSIPPTSGIANKPPTILNICLLTFIRIYNPLLLTLFLRSITIITNLIQKYQKNAIYSVYL